MSKSGWHFPCGQGSKVGFAPIRLDTFAIGTPGSRHVVERINDVTGFSVGGEMELRNHKHDFVLLDVDLELGREVFHPFGEVLRELTGDIIG